MDNEDRYYNEIDDLKDRVDEAKKKIKEIT